MEKQNRARKNGKMLWIVLTLPALLLVVLGLGLVVYTAPMFASWLDQTKANESGLAIADDQPQMDLNAPSDAVPNGSEIDYADDVAKIDEQADDIRGLELDVVDLDADSSNIVAVANTGCTYGRDVDRAFFSEVLGQLGIPVSNFALDVFEPWKRAENTSACWNPLATTQPESGATKFNSVGVRNYPDRATGVRGTKDTLVLSYYNAIRAMLRQESFNRDALRQALITWSGNGAYVNNVLNQWEAFWNARPQPPAAPGNARLGNATTNALTLAWDDRSNNEQGFKIERRNGGSWSQIATVGANATSYTSGGLNAGAQYCFRVRAYNSVGDSNYSNETCASTKTPPPTPPNTPSSARLENVATNSITVRWNDNSNNETEFRIERKTNWWGGWSQVGTVGANSTGFSNGGLGKGTTYYYRVRACNSAGCSGYSNETNATTRR